MSRRHRRMGGHEEGGAHGGSWKIALADMMTVLMAFFLVMWLAAMVEPEKRAEFANALLNLGHADKQGEHEEPVTGEQVIDPIPELAKPLLTQEEILQVMSDRSNVEVEETDDYLKITLKSDHFFESGRATISDRVREELEHLGELLAGRNLPISITGHTDNIPIHTLQFPSNWELSAARAATVARVFIDMGVNPALITVSGRADQDPVAPNDTRFGRAMNRRVVIYIDKRAQAEAEQMAHAGHSRSAMVPEKVLAQSH